MLRGIVAANRATQFGEEHRFAGVTTARQFRERVPVQDYETLRGYIDSQRQTGAPALTAEAADLLRADERVHRAAEVHSDHRVGAPPASRRAGALHLPAVSGLPGRVFRQGAGHHGRRGRRARSTTGHHVGSVSGYLYESLPAAVQSRFVVPPQVSTIADYDLKYLVILRLALAARDITLPGLAESFDVPATARRS